VQIIAKLEKEKTRMAQDHVESAKSLKDHITTQSVEELIEKVVYGKDKGEELEGNSLAEAIQEVCTN
jgi:hypothetical protein